MIKADHRTIAVKFFDWYISKIIKKDFHNIEYDKSFNFDKNKAILLIPNHFSWWDGFFAYFLNLYLFKKKFHVMMLEKELSKRPIFKYIGAFSVEQKSETVEETLNYTSELLNNKDNLVLMFPQGRIESNHKEKVTFRKGIEYLVNNSGNNFQLIYSTTLIDYLANRKATAYMYLEKLALFKGITVKELEEKYNEFYQKAKNIQSELWK